VWKSERRTVLSWTQRWSSSRRFQKNTWSCCRLTNRHSSLILKPIPTICFHLRSTFRRSLLILSGRNQPKTEISGFQPLYIGTSVHKSTWPTCPTSVTVMAMDSTSLSGLSSNRTRSVIRYRLKRHFSWRNFHSANPRLQIIAQLSQFSASMMRYRANNNLFQDGLRLGAANLFLISLSSQSTTKRW